MPEQVINFEGTEHHFPDDFTQADIAKALAVSHPQKPKQSEGFAENWPEPMKSMFLFPGRGAIQFVQGVKELAQPNKGWQAGTDIMQGGGKAIAPLATALAAPALGGALLEAPVATLLGLGGGAVGAEAGHVIGSTGAGILGASPEAQEFFGTAGELPGAALGGLVGSRIPGVTRSVMDAVADTPISRDLVGMISPRAAHTAGVVNKSAKIIDALRNPDPTAKLLRQIRRKGVTASAPEMPPPPSAGPSQAATAEQYTAPIVAPTPIQTPEGSPQLPGWMQNWIAEEKMMQQPSVIGREPIWKDIPEAAKQVPTPPDVSESLNLPSGRTPGSLATQTEERVTPKGAKQTVVTSKKSATASPFTPAEQEAIDATVALGGNRGEAAKAVLDLRTQQGPNLSFEDIIRGINKGKSTAPRRGPANAPSPTPQAGPIPKPPAPSATQAKEVAVPIAGTHQKAVDYVNNYLKEAEKSGTAGVLKSDPILDRYVNNPNSFGGLHIAKRAYAKDVTLADYLLNKGVTPEEWSSAGLQKHNQWLNDAEKWSGRKFNDYDPTSRATNPDLRSYEQGIEDVANMMRSDHPMQIGATVRMPEPQK